MGFCAFFRALTADIRTKARETEEGGEESTLPSPLPPFFRFVPIPARSCEQRKTDKSPKKTLATRAKIKVLRDLISTHIEYTDRIHN